MNVKDISGKLRAVAGLRLDVLSDTDLERFKTQLDKIHDKIVRLEKAEVMNSLETDVPFPLRTFFAAYSKKRGLKRPGKTARIELFDDYIADYKRCMGDFKKRTNALNKTLDGLKRASDEDALVRLEGMDAAELDDLSRLANLRKPGAKKATLFKIPKGKKGRLDWLALTRRSEFKNWF